MEKTVNIFSKGLYTDTNPLSQPKGTYRFLLNGKLEGIRGAKGDLSNELGNTICAELPEGYEPIGSVLDENNNTIICLSNNETSIIGIQSKNCSFTPFITTSCLGWTTHNHLDIEFRLKSGCDRVLYILDGNSSPVSVNLDSLQSFLPDTVINDDSLPTNSEKIDYANNNDLWDCNKLRIFPDLIVPCLSIDSINDGGGRIEVGVHQFAIRYLDGDSNPTDWFSVGQPIPIYDENLGTDYYLIDGGVSGDGENTGDGDLALPPTNKSITFNVSNLDTSFVYYQIAVLESTDGIGNISNVRIKAQRTIPGDSDTYIYTGPDPNSDITGTLDEIVTPRFVINKAKHVEQIDNRLLMANVSGKAFDWPRLQRIASAVGTSWKTTTGSKTDINNLSPKTPELWYEYRGYMRDEVYAFGLVFIFKDGTESPAFHIPGRPKNTNPVDCETIPTASDGSGITTTLRRLNVEFSKAGVPVGITSWEVTYVIAGKEFTQTGTFSTTSSSVIVTIDRAGIDQEIEILDTNIVNQNGAGTVNIYVNNQTVTSPDQNVNRYPESWFDWDSTEYTYDSTTTNDTNLNHLDLQDGDTYERWQAENTAIRLDGDIGIMGYYECSNSTYSDVRDCEGESIWGEDICGNPLAGTPIRHHRMPDARLVEIQNESSLYYLGVQFHNIEIPQDIQDEIEGYYIVRVHRDEINSTVIEKGILDRAETYKGDPRDLTDGNAHFAYFRSETSVNNSEPFGFADDVFVFHSPKGFFYRQFFGGNFFKIERQWDEFSTDVRRTSQDFTIYEFKDNGDQPPAAYTNRFIQDSSYIDRIQQINDGSSTIGTTLNGWPVLNYLGSNHLFYTYIPDTIDNSYFYYVAIKNSRDVYCNLDSLQYHKTHNCIISPSTKSQLIYGGDTFISRIDWSLQDYDTSRSYMSAYVESTINSELRHNGDTFCDKYFQGPTDDIERFSALRRWQFRFVDMEEFNEDEDLIEHWVCGDPWYYNIDFSKENGDNTYFPLSTTFDYCKRCIEEYPYRIYYSEQSFQEETTDNYEAILTNNYTDLLGDQGEVTDMFIDKDRLFVHTVKALWQVQTKPNEILTNESTIFVGAGELLSIPPRNLVTTEYGYGGSIDKWSNVTTEFGTFFADSRMGKVFLLTQGLGEISESGMMRWLDNNLEIELLGVFEDLTGEAYPANQFVGKFGVGLYAVYDPQHRLYVLSKRDFLPTEAFTSSFSGILTDDTVLTEGNIYFDSSNATFFQRINQFNKELSFLDKEFFENKSWTMSYDIVNKSWASFHSYLPSYMFANETTFFSYVRQNNNTWKHNAGEYQTYYGVKHPFIVEYVSKADSAVEKIFTSIEYLSRVKLYDTSNRDDIEITNVTFDKFYCYNRDQITSTNNIVVKTDPYQTVNGDLTTSVADRTDNVYRISQNIRDIAISRNSLPLHTSSWSDSNYSSKYDVDGLGNGYIDKVPLETARDINKDVYERSKMKDKFIITRLESTADENYEFNLQLSSKSTEDKNR